MATRPLKQQPAQEPAPRPALEAQPQGGFTMEDVKRLVQLVEKTDVTHLAWQRGTERVVIRRGALAAPASAIAPVVHAAPVAAPVAAPPLVAAVPAAVAAPKAEARADKPG